MLLPLSLKTARGACHLQLRTLGPLAWDDHAMNTLPVQSQAIDAQLLKAKGQRIEASA
jgi:hypothetical protein